LRTKNQSDDEDGDSSLQGLTKKYKEIVEFAEPQSMNYDMKLNQAFKDFISSQTKDGKRGQLASREQGRFEVEEEFDDLLFRAPDAQRKINKMMASSLKQKKLYN
jgi:hypothetical protein